MTRAEIQLLESTATDQPLWRKALAWVAVAAVAAPIAIVLHEIGHYVVGMLFGFPDLVLHYGSVTHGGRAAGSPQWQLGLQTAAGPLVTLAIVGACCVAVSRRGAGPLTVAPALAAGVRTVAIGLGYVATRLLYPGEVNPNFDEYNVALAFGVSPDLVVLLSSLGIVTGWVYLIRHMPDRRALALASAGAGTIAGLIIYIAVLGPALLP